jgi:ATP-dependent Clp protease, protease subunit
MSEEKKNREFMLSGSVTETNIADLIKEIRALNKHDDEQEKKVVDYKREPIQLVVSTFGGSAYDCLGLIAAMELSKTPIHTICYTKAMSAGFTIFVSGHKRFIHPYATLMYHTVRGGAIGDVEWIKTEGEEMERLHKLLEDIAVKKTGILREKFESVRKLRQDWMIPGEEAKKLGCADELLGA